MSSNKQFVCERINEDLNRISRLRPSLTVDNAESAIEYFLHDKSTEPTEENILMGIRQGGEIIRLFTPNNISAIVSASKVGKSTFAYGCIIAPFINGNTTIESNNDKIYAYHSKIKKILIIDTEQANNDIAHKVKQLKKLSGTAIDKVEILAFRGSGPEEILIGLKTYLELNDDVDFILIDGIADIQPDTNDIKESANIVKELMYLSILYDCHILNIIHNTKTSERGTGHLGSSLEKKCETVITLKKDEMFGVQVQPSYTRGRPFEPFFFSIENGLPVVNSDAKPSKDSKNKAYSPDNIGPDAFIKWMNIEFERTDLNQSIGPISSTDFKARISNMLSRNGMPSGRDSVRNTLAFLEKKKIVNKVNPEQGNSRHTKYMYDPKPE